MNVKSAALSVVNAVKNKPYTFGLIAWQVGMYVAPTATILASMFYTGMHLGTKATQEWTAALEAALEKREAEKAHMGEVTDVP